MSTAATTPSSVVHHPVRVWNGRITLNVQVAGQGPALVYFHPAAGFRWDPFLTALTAHHTVYAPEFPGTTPGDPHAIHQVDELGDAVLLLEEAMRSLGLQGAVAVGQSFGGMLAAELGAAFPALFSRLVLLGPVGLWRDDAPAQSPFAAAPDQLPAMLFKNPASPAAQAALAMPPDPEAAVMATAQMIWNLGCTGKFLWPLPDRGLEKRLHRISAPTLLVWGEDDALIPVSYAGEFARLIAGSRVEIIRDCGHIPQVEQMAPCLKAVRAFLDG